MAGADRLSGLSDDLLASVISLLPTREAVRTAALSRRWRPVWLRTHSLILESRSYGDRPATQDRIFSDAHKFLGATGPCSSHVRKLSLSVHGRTQEHLERLMGNPVWGTSGDSLMASLLPSPALRYLEEVRVKLEGCQREELSGSVYKLDPAVLPAHTLRVLDLEFCRLESAPSAAAVSFPRLSALRLHRCLSSTKDLEGWIRTAPSLGSLHIQEHNFYSRSDDTDTRSDSFALHSPSLTALTLVPGSWRGGGHFELDVPRLRAFKYNGKFQAFSMKSQTTKLVRVDLALRRIYDDDGRPVQTWFAPFWQLLRNFRHAKAIKLTVPAIEGIAVDKGAEHEHLFTLPALERLELRGFSDPGRRDNAALAIANLLQCCPVIHELRIRIPTDPYRAPYVSTSTKAQVSYFDVSMDVFRRRFSKEMMDPLMLNRDDDGCSLPALTGCRFRCLENHLKSVTLQFELMELNSFEVCLAKFFTENSMVLEVLQIDDGRQNFLSHINWMVERWRANALKRRKQMEHNLADSSKQRGKRKRNYRVYDAE